MKAETDSGERPEVKDGPRNVVGIGDGATLREAAERMLDELSQLREQVKVAHQILDEHEAPRYTSPNKICELTLGGRISDLVWHLRLQAESRMASLSSQLAQELERLRNWFSQICEAVYPDRDYVTTNGEFVAEEIRRLRERNAKLASHITALETENKALKADFDWLDTHVVRVSNPKDELIFFRAPGASPTRTYIAEARSAGESPNAS